MKKFRVLKLLLSFLLTMLLIYACRQENFLNEKEASNKVNSTIRILKLSQIPKVEKYLKKQIGREDFQVPLARQGKTSKLGLDLGNISTDLVVEKELGDKIYYILEVTNPKSTDVIYNLEIKEKDGEQLSIRIIEYNNKRGKTKDFNKFTGRVSAYRIDGDPISSVDYTDGVGDCSPGGGVDPTYNGSEDPNPGDGGNYNSGSGSGYNGTEPISSDCWDIVLDPDKPWLTLGYYNNCTGQYISLYGVESLTPDCGDGSGVIIVDPPATPTPCEKIVTENTKLKSITDKELFISNKNTITANINTDTNEKSFSYGVDSNNVFKTTPIKESTTGNSVGIDVTYTGLTVQGGTHTHYKNLYASFSIRDFYLFKNSNASNSNFKNYFAFGADGHTYALSITDEEKFNNFLTNYPLSTFYDATNDEWNKVQPIGLDFDTSYQQFMINGKTDDEAYALAQALVLNKYGAGMSISRQESDGTFKGLFINETKVPMNVGGVFINVSVFTQIDNCNL